MFLNVPDELALQLLALLRVDLRSFCCSSHLSTLPKFCKKSSLSCRIFQHGSQYNILLHAPFRCSVPSLHSHTTFATLLPFWLLFYPNWKMWQQWHLNLFFVCAVVLLNSTCQCTWSNFACWKEKCVPWRRGVFLSLILFKYLTHSRKFSSMVLVDCFPVFFVEGVAVVIELTTTERHCGRSRGCCAFSSISFALCMYPSHTDLMNSKWVSGFAACSWP